MSNRSTPILTDSPNAVVTHSNKEASLISGDTFSAITILAGATITKTYSTNSNPTVNNDKDDTAGIGYASKVRDFWVNTSTGDIYVCSDNSTGAAVWNQINGLTTLHALLTDTATNGHPSDIISYDNSVSLLTATNSQSAITELNTQGTGHISIIPHNYNSIGQGNWGLSASSAVWSYFYWHNSITGTQANGDNISYKVYLQKGTYTIRLLAVQAANKGIIDVDIDSTEVASFDMYKSGVAVPNTMFTQTGIIISTSGLKTLKLRIDGRNASSSDYVLLLSSISIWRTA